MASEPVIPADPGAGPGPNPPWGAFWVDNGARYWLNEQLANEPPDPKRVVYILAPDGHGITIDTFTAKVLGTWEAPSK